MMSFGWLASAMACATLALAQVETRLLKGSYLLATASVDLNGNEFLSADVATRQSVSTTTQDLGTGRQRWKLVYGGPDWYSIVSDYGAPGTYDYLGTTDVNQFMVSAALYPADDGSGLQRWQLNKVPLSTTGSYYIRPYLSALTNTSLWLTQSFDMMGTRIITLIRNATGPGSQWQALQFSGEYNLIIRGNFLSASTQFAGRGLGTSPNDNGSGQQRVQLLRRLDGLYYIVVEGTSSLYKYLSVLSGTPAQAYLDVRQSPNSNTWIVTSSTSGTFTVQDSRYGFYLTLPRTAGSTQFLASGYVGDGSLNWALQPTSGAPSSGCISNVGNGQFLQGPLGSSWLLIRGPASNWYQIKSASSANTFSYLSLGAYSPSIPYLVSQDDGSGAQRWEINPAPIGYYIQPWVTTNISGQYLVAGYSTPVSVASQLDGSSLQTFYIGQCPTQPLLSSAGAIAIGCVFGIGGGLLLIAAAYYYYTRYCLKQAGSEQDLAEVEKGVEPTKVGNAFEDHAEIKVEVKEPPTLAGQFRELWDRLVAFLVALVGQVHELWSRLPFIRGRVPVVVASDTIPGETDLKADKVDDQEAAKLSHRPSRCLSFCMPGRGGSVIAA